MGKYKTRVIIVVVSVLVVVGTGLGIYFAVRGSGPGSNERADSTPPETTETDATATSVPTVRVETDANVTRVPTGKRDRIAFLGNGDIYVVEMDGTGEKKLTNRGDIYGFAVSPNGQWIAFEAYSEDQNEILKIRSDGTQESQVTQPAKYVSRYPAFDPTGQYIYYFTRVNPQSRQDIPEGFAADDLECYNIKTSIVDRVYTLHHRGEQDVEGLWADPNSGALYYNLMGSDFPSGEPHKITLGQQVPDSVYMPKEFSADLAVYYHLTGLSMDGTYVSYFKWIMHRSPGEASRMEDCVCYRASSGNDEKVVVTEMVGPNEKTAFSGFEFSSVSDNTYYVSKTRYSKTTNETTLTFFTGTTATSSPEETGLTIVIPWNQETHSEPTWHLLATY